MVLIFMDKIISVFLAAGIVLSLLPFSALADDEHAEVGRRDLHRHVERPVKRIAVADDAVTLFYFLKFRCVHFELTKLHIFFHKPAILAENLLHLTNYITFARREQRGNMPVLLARPSVCGILTLLTTTDF